MSRINGLASVAGVNPAALTVSPLGWAVLFPVAYLVSVALHECGPLFLARLLRLKVRGVTLMALGGVVELGPDSRKPYAGLQLALAGPVASVVTAGLLLVLRRSFTEPDVAFFTHWIGIANIALATFNLLPAYPLDAGQAFHSALAARHGRVRATYVMARFSKLVALAVGVLGLRNFDLLVLLIAFHVYACAQGEQLALLTEGMLHGLRVGQLALPCPAISDRANLADAMISMMNQGSPVLPVREGATSRPLLITQAQVRRVPRDFWSVTLVRDVMEEARRSLDLRDTITETVIQDLLAAPEGCLPVTDRQGSFGYLRGRDVTAILQFRVSAGTPALVRSPRVRPGSAA